MGRLLYTELDKRELGVLFESRRRGIIANFLTRRQYIQAPEGSPCFTFCFFDRVTSPDYNSFRQPYTLFTRADQPEGGVNF
jgi:hypothetical protein